jgi:hypothetical protein
MNTTKTPPIPKKYTRKRKVEFWGATYNVTPAVCKGHLGDGKLLLGFQCANTRPDYYLIRVGSDFFEDNDGDTDGYERIDVVIDAIEDEFGEKEREREYLMEDLKSQGIEPTAENTDLNGNEDRLGWPVLSLDSGYHWWEVCRLKEPKEPKR